MTAQTFEDATTYSWLTPSGEALGEFHSIEEAEEWPLVDEYMVLIGFDDEGNEL